VAFSSFSASGQLLISANGHELAVSTFVKVCSYDRKQLRSFATSSKVNTRPRAAGSALGLLSPRKPPVNG